MGKQKTLGSTLRRLRAISTCTLREIEDATGISNAYLSQLENDKIRKPSANYLYKLASVYRVDMTELMFLAGLITEDSFKKQEGFFKALKAGEITVEEETALLEYLKFLRSK